MNGRRTLPALGAVLVVAAAACALLWPMVRAALTPEERFHEWDVPEQYWPDLVYLCDALHDGELPAWNPYDRAGYPYAADPQAGAYHPLNWAICAAAGRSPSPSWAELRVFLGFLMTGLFGLLWLRRYRLPWSAAVVGAVVLQAAPFMRHNWELNLTAALAYLPLMLWAADRAAVERRARDGALLALAVALCAWVGSPPALWLAGTYTGGFWLARLAGEAIRGASRRREILAAGLRAGLAAAALGAGLTLVVLEPGAELARHSVQAGRSFESIAEGGLALGHLTALVAPRPGNHLYVGLLVLALAPFAFFPRRSHPQPLSGSAERGDVARGLPCRSYHLAMAIAAVLMALGANGPLFGLSFDWVPGVALFRLPYRYEAWLGPALGALAAAGLAWLTGLGARRPLSRRWSDAAHLALGVTLSVLLLLDVTRGLPPDRHTRPGPHPCRAEVAEAVLARAPRAGLGERYMDEFAIACRSGTRLRRRDLRGYQDPLLLASYERVMAALAEHPRLIEQFDVRYVLAGPHFIHGWNRHYLPPPAALRAIPGVRDLGAGVLELPGTLPAAYWVPLDRVERARDRPAALRRLEAIAPAAVAILDGAVTGLTPGPSPSFAGRGDDAPRHGLPLSAEPERRPRGEAASSFALRRDGLRARVAAPAPGVVVINEAWYPGWRAWVDGVEAPVYRANALVRAVFVERGDHRIEMKYSPRDVVALRWVFCLAWVLCALLIALPTRGSAGRAPRRRAR
jgi:hypothetical protein